MKWMIGYSLPCRAVKISRERAFKTESGISIKPHKGEQWCYCPSDPAPQVFSVLAACQHLPCLILSILPILSLPLSLVTSTYSNMFQLYLILHISLTARTFMTNNSEWHLPSFCVPSHFFFFFFFFAVYSAYQSWKWLPTCLFKCGWSVPVGYDILWAAVIPVLLTIDFPVPIHSPYIN